MKIEIIDGVKKHAFHCAADWNTLSRRDLILWCGILRLELTVSEALDLAAYAMYRIPKKLYRNLTPVLRVQIRYTLDYLEKNSLTANVIGKIRIGFKSYHGPSNRLSNITIGEYRRTELYYDLYQRTGEQKYLYLLAATLWRNAGGKGDDIRRGLSERAVSRRARFFSWALHPNILLAIKLYYEGCRTYIQRSFPTIYKKPGHVQNTVNTNSHLQDLEDHILAYSGGKFGSFAETENTNLYLFLKHMSERIDNYEKTKK